MRVRLLPLLFTSLLVPPAAAPAVAASPDAFLPAADRVGASTADVAAVAVVSIAPAGPGVAVDAPAPLAARPGAAAVRGRRPHVARYRPPVDAPVRDPFRPPACTWCAGNRGLEYDTSPDQDVVASASGVVTFAGRVAGRLWVVVGHPDGLRTSYGLLLGIDVAVGRAVRAGDRLGSAGEALHFGVRRGDVYLDPASLLGGAAFVPRLVPIDGAPSRWPRA